MICHAHTGGSPAKLTKLLPSTIPGPIAKTNHSGATTHIALRHGFSAGLTASMSLSQSFISIRTATTSGLRSRSRRRVSAVMPMAAPNPTIPPQPALWMLNGYWVASIT